MIVLSLQHRRIEYVAERFEVRFYSDDGQYWGFLLCEGTDGEALLAHTSPWVVFIAAQLLWALGMAIGNTCVTPALTACAATGEVASLSALGPMASAGGRIVGPPILGHI